MSFDVHPTIGMGATISFFSDSYACTVVGVEKDGWIVTVREDEHTLVDGHGQSEHQVYTYSQNPAGRHYTFRRDLKNGKLVWREVARSESGRWRLTGSRTRLTLNLRRTYRDPSF